MKHAAALNRLSALALRPSRWTPELARMAACLPTDAPGVNAAWLADQVTSGLSRVAEIERDGHSVGFVVFCVTPSHELIVQAAFARAGVSILAELAADFDTIARRCDCDTIRFHTMRPGLVRQTQALGYHVSEIIMRKAIVA